MAVQISENLTLRPITMADVEAITDLKNIQMEAILGQRTLTVSQIRTDWESPGFDIENAGRVLVNPAGEMIGSIVVWDNDAVPVHVGIDLDIHPDYNDTDVGRQLFDWAEERAYQAIDRVPENARVVLSGWTLDSYAPRKHLLDAMGMKHIRSFYTMRIDMDSPPQVPTWPEGIRVRQFNRETDELALVKAVDEAFKDHWGYVEEPFEEVLKHWRHWMDTSEFYDPTLWFLAMDGDEIVGVSLCEPRSSESPDAGYVADLAVRRPWRRRGIATALLQHSFGKLWKRGKQAVTLGVDASSLTNATRLYEKVGMRVSRHWLTYEKELRPGEDLSRQSLAD